MNLKKNCTSRRISIWVMFVLVLPIFASSKELHIQISDGKDIVFSLSKSPKLMFYKSELLIVSDNQSISIPTDKIESFQYLDNLDESGFENAENAQLISFTKSGLIINNQCAFSITLINGSVFYNATSFQGTFLYRDMPKGVLILKINDISIKINNR